MSDLRVCSDYVVEGRLVERGCGLTYDADEQYGACPHNRYPQRLVDAIAFSHAHPAYHNSHEHEFYGQTVTHHHYVLRGLENDPEHHKHPIIAERYRSEAI